MPVVRICVYVSVPVFEVLDTADAFEGSVDHDGQASTQRLALLHAAQLVS